MKRKVILLGIDSVPMRLIRRFVDEGILPNMKRLMEEGSYGDALPSFPAYTPTNWAALCTGAHPGTTGASNWARRMENGQILSTFDSRTINCETIWEAAEKSNLKSLIVQYPGSYPPRISSGYVVAPLYKGLTTLQILPGGEYTTDEPMTENDRRIRISEATNWKGLDSRNLTEAKEAEIWILREGELSEISSSLAAKLAGATEDGAEIGPETKVQKAGKVKFELKFNLLAYKDKNGSEKVILTSKKNASDPLAELRIGQWSKWILTDIPTANGLKRVSMRFKLRKFDLSNGKISLIRSEIYPVVDFTYPDSLSKELIEKVGPFFEHTALFNRCHLRKYRDLDRIEEDMETVFEELDYQVDWFIRSAKYIDKKYGWDLYYLHWHFPDSALHAFLSAADPESPAYERKRGEFALEKLRKTLILCDKLLKGFMDNFGDNSYIVVVSDHGNSPNKYICDITKFLCENNLAVLDSEGRLDISKSKVYPFGGLQLNINLKGREKTGIVEEKDFIRLQEEIIDKLLDWRVPNSNKRVIAFALTKEQAQVIGYWGPTVGDIIFCYNGGFAWGKVEKGSVEIAPLSANHGCQYPTTSTKLSSILGCFMISGPGIKKGFEWPKDDLGYIKLIDVVPTLCYLLHIRPPRQARGSVLYELME